MTRQSMTKILHNKMCGGIIIYKISINGEAYAHIC